MSKWAAEHKRRWEKSKFVKLWEKENKAGRDPRQAFKNRGWGREAASARRATVEMPMPKKKQESPFPGRWQLVSMDEWDVDDTEEGPAFIEFGADQMGEFRFGLTSGDIDYRITERGGQPSVEWTWEGMDEMDLCTGRGWAVLEGDELHGMTFFHQGDDSGFVAKRAKEKRAPKRK